MISENSLKAKVFAQSKKIVFSVPTFARGAFLNKFYKAPVKCSPEMIIKAYPSYWCKESFLRPNKLVISKPKKENGFTYYYWYFYCSIRAVVFTNDVRGTKEINPIFLQRHFN